MADQFMYSGEFASSKPLVAQDIHKEYGEKVVLVKESVSINQGDKVGLVGRNGTGKSTLMRILADLEHPDSGKVINPDLKIGYLPQDYTLDAEKTVYEVATEGVAHLASAVKEFDQISANYRAGDAEFEARYGQLLELLQKNDAFNLADKVQSILTHLGVARDFNAKVATLSGGQTVRLALARLLISRPDVLLLDEPTNHLDLHANLWLREFLSEWQGGLLVVSHDRDFLNEITTSTWELDEGKIKVYGGNYEFYKKQKGIEEEAREREVVRLSGEVKKAHKQVEQEKKRAAHSARKDLNRNPDDFDKVRAHYFKERAGKTAGRKKKVSEGKEEGLQTELEEARRKAAARISPSIQESETHKGKLLVSAKHLSCSYDGETIIEDADLNIHFGDRIALFGNNGAGKSTLIKGMLGWDGVQTNEGVKIAPDINVQLLDQRYAIVDRSQTVLQNIQLLAKDQSVNDLRQHLARFLFRETPEVNKPASVLSGGEVARLALAMIAIQPIDLLVLDEPTNNLDVASVEEIESVLKEFKGAILIVSHDITFLTNIGVSHSYVVSDKVVTPMMRNPEDGKGFKEELLASL